MFVGREEDLRDLAVLMRKKTPSLVTCPLKSCGQRLQLNPFVVDMLQDDL